MRRVPATIPTDCVSPVGLHETLAPRPGNILARLAPAWPRRNTFSTLSAHFDLQASRTLDVPLWGANFQPTRSRSFALLDASLCQNLQQHLHRTLSRLLFSPQHPLTLISSPSQWSTTPELPLAVAPATTVSCTRTCPTSVRCLCAASLPLARRRLLCRSLRFVVPEAVAAAIARNRRAIAVALTDKPD